MFSFEVIEIHQSVLQVNMFKVLSFWGYIWEGNDENRFEKWFPLDIFIDGYLIFCYEKKFAVGNSSLLDDRRRETHENVWHWKR